MRSNVGISNLPYFIVSNRVIGQGVPKCTESARIGTEYRMPRNKAIFSVTGFLLLQPLVLIRSLAETENTTKRRSFR